MGGFCETAGSDIWITGAVILYGVNSIANSLSQSE